MRRLLSALVFLLATQAAAQADPPDAVFPIPGETRATVELAEGHFRASRPGRKPQRGCGRGHCGIDLSATDGTPVVAVREGIVGQVERGDRDRAGRWGASSTPSSSPTHLHFALSVGLPRSPRYLDPEPLLRTASLLAEAHAPSRATALAPSAPDASRISAASAPPDL